MMSLFIGELVPLQMVTLVHKKAGDNDDDYLENGGDVSSGVVELDGDGEWEEEEREGDEVDGISVKDFHGVEMTLVHQGKGFHVGNKEAKVRVKGIMAMGLRRG
ncbi:hypothetical protein Tco_1033532 [Tanacetum coccineum]